jgi:regulator of cell morphogenesis and NO signaling
MKMTDTVLNFDSFEPHVQHAIVFSLYEGLRDGESFHIQNSTEPKSLYEELSAVNIPALNCEYVERGPDKWKIRISKQGQEKKKQGCCGICGGH